MKIANKTLIDAINALDPAAVSAVIYITLHLENGRIFYAQNVTTDNQMLWAKGDSACNISGTPLWLYVPIDQVVGFEVMIDETLLEKEDGVTLPEIIKSFGSRG